MYETQKQNICVEGGNQTELGNKTIINNVVLPIFQMIRRDQYLLMFYIQRRISNRIKNIKKKNTGRYKFKQTPQSGKGKKLFPISKENKIPIVYYAFAVGVLYNHFTPSKTITEFVSNIRK